MNRLLVVPAVCCALAFAALNSRMNRANDLESNSKNGGIYNSNASLPLAKSPLNVSNAEQQLGSLRDEYMRRWRTWEHSSHRLLSRAAPRTLSPSSVDIALSPVSSDQCTSFVLATISVRRREQAQTIPCVVDPTAKQIRLFHEGKWITEDEWLRTTPLVTKASP